MPSLHHLAPEQSMAIPHVPLGGHGQAEMVKENPWSWCGDKVSGASHCKVPSVPWGHKALSCPQNQSVFCAQELCTRPVMVEGVPWQGLELHDLPTQTIP